MKRSLFLSLGLGAALLSSLACGGGDSDSPDTNAFPTSVDAASNLPTSTIKPVNVQLAGVDYFVGRNNFVFGVLDAKDIPQGGAKARVTFYDLSDRAKPKAIGTYDAVQSAPGVGEQVTHIHESGETHLHGGQDDGRVGYYVDVTLPHAGFWGVVFDITLKDGTTGQRDIGFQVFEQGRFPQPGEKAIASDNLTRFDVQKIEEIDSGSPANDMHDLKIKDSLAKGRPVVVVFATPAFCVSRFCGPVTEEIEYLHDQYKDQVDFIHIEIWRDFGKKEFNPTTREWLVQQDGSLLEPWVYVIGKDGVIYDRWEGPAARNIVEPAVKAVAAGETYATRK